MSDSEFWNLLEALRDPATPASQRAAAEAKLAANPQWAELWSTASLLEAWPALEEVTLGAAPSGVLEVVQAEQSRQALAWELGRAFPFVAAAGLAAALALAALNFMAMRDASNNTLDAVFGLPAPTIDHTLLAQR